MQFSVLNEFVCSLKGIDQLTEKQEAIVEVLAENFSLSTKDIVSKVFVDWGGVIEVSERQVQRIRKLIIDGFNETLAIRKGGSIPMGENIHGLDAVELDIINAVNAGKEEDEWYSIDLLADEFNVTREYVIEVLTDFHFMISGKIYDKNAEIDIAGYIEKYINLQPELASDDAPDGDVFDTGAEAKDEGVTPAPAPVKGKGGNGADAGFWEVQIDCVTACSKVNPEVPVFMGRLTRKKAMMFMKWAGAREWLAYLVGEKNEDGSYNIHDLYLPDQRASSTLVDQVNADEYNNMTIVGVIHSHHEMGAGDEDNPSFSGHDAAFINGNHNLSLLAGRDRVTGGFKIVGIARTQTPCGGLMQVKAKVRPMKEEPDAEEQAIHAEFKEKVLDKPANNGYASGSNQGGHGNGRHGHVQTQPQLVDTRYFQGGGRR